MKRIVILLMLLALLAACRTMPVAGECPESVGVKCVLGKDCWEDEKRGCRVCRCASIAPDDYAAKSEEARGRSPDHLH